MPEARQFYLSLPGRFEQILAAARPQLQEVFRTWLQQDLPQDIFTVVKLAGFGLEDAKAQPVQTEERRKKLEMPLNPWLIAVTKPEPPQREKVISSEASYPKILRNRKRRIQRRLDPVNAKR